MAWQPVEQPLQQLAQYLKDSLDPRNPSVQKNAELMLKQAKSSPDINNYLAFLLSSSQPPPPVSMNSENYFIVRSQAAILLKNHVKSSYRTISDSSKAYIRSVILSGLGDTNNQIRNFTGNVITEIVRQGGIMGWPQVLAELIDLIENKAGSVPGHTQEGAMSALAKICEDNKRALDKDYGGERPLAFMFPKLLEFTTSPLPKVRTNALSSIDGFLPELPQTIVPHLENLLLQLFRLAGDANEEVRKYVCRTFIRIAEVRPEMIVPHMAGLVDFMIAQQRNPDDTELALDAAEFWLCVGEDESLRTELGPYLPKIVPVLLESMVYCEDDIIRLESSHDDAEQEDREEDIKPNFATSKGGRLAAASNGETEAPNKNGARAEGRRLSEGELEDYSTDSDYDDDDDYGADPEEQWNLRKCSAAALDVLASVFHEPVFAVTLPYLKDNLNHAEWPNREAAVLALGAIADGCMDVVQPHLPDLTQYLITLLQDQEPVVRQITCWSLGRYSEWAASLDDAGKRQYFEPIMDGILKRMLDSKKRVQEAAASAFANLEEKAKESLRPYCLVIIRQFVECFQRYKDRNMFILYDCVQTLAEHVGPELARPELVELLMPALIGRWQKVPDESREMFPLLECLSYVATALSESFAPFAQPIFARCIKVIHQNLEESLRASNNPALDMPEKDFLITSLDLVSALVQALGEPKGSQLVATSQPNLFELMTFCMKDENNDVRQSAYALLGDCGIYVFDQLQPFLPTILEISIDQLDLTKANWEIEDTGFSVVNNACWSIGEIAMKQQEGMAPYVDKLLPRLVTILFNQKIPRSLSENAAISLGRLGSGCPTQLAPHLGTFALAFVRIVRNIAWTDEKADALGGFVKVILCNPQAMEQSLLEFFVELSNAAEQKSYLRPPRREEYQAVFTAYKSLIPDFDAFINHMPPDRAQVLRQAYQL